MNGNLLVLSKLALMLTR